MEHNPNPQATPAAPVASSSTAGSPRVLATYPSVRGGRRLVAQRVDGKVAVCDVPATGHGRVYLVERHVGSVAELDAIVADYRQLATALGRSPMAADWIYQ
jgi:hypothetical protein